MTKQKVKTILQYWQKYYILQQIKTKMSVMDEQPVIIHHKNQGDDQFNQIFQLQQIYLENQIAKELEERDLYFHQLPSNFLRICKNSQAEDEFIIKAQEIIGSTVSKHFLVSLFNTVRQKLPRVFELSQQNQSPIKIEAQEKIQHHEEEKGEKNSKSEKKLKNQIEEQKKFPGLSIPNNADEIQLDLGFQEVVENKGHEKEVVKETEKQVEKQKYFTEEKDDKIEKYKEKYDEKDRQYDEDDYEKRKHKKDKRKKEKEKRRYSRSRSHERQNQRKRNKSRERSRSRQKKKQRERKRSHEKEVKLETIEEKGVYKGKLTTIHKNGCIVKLKGVENSLQCLLHSDEIEQKYSKSLKEGDKVWVKVITILNDRVRLTMKGIDQRSGYDINSREQKREQDDDVGRLTGIKIEHEGSVDKEGNAASYGQMWQISRMSYMGGVVKNKPIIKEDIEEVIVEMNDKQPPFLRGQTTKAGISLSPVRVIKNPQGTLQREALNAVQYAKQRRQIREQQTKTEVRDLTKILEEVTPRPEIHRQPKRSANTIKAQKTMLPIHGQKQKFIKACMNNKMLIIIGETGSGKTTQITQYLHEAGFSKNGKIGCTQPRRVAAMSVAKRVAEEMNVKLGDEVGYSIRFEDYTSHKTIIKYMTDGMLLREALIDKDLKQYSVIMLDEAHERTIHTDVLFGILKKVVEKRDDFTLIVTSATLEARKFSSYFFDCKIFSIPGRTYNVEILYAKEPQTDYLDASLMCIMQIHIDQPPGDILLFLTGQQQIDTSCQILKERLRKMGDEIPQLIILPVYSALPSQLQTKIFEPAPRGKRKCVIATNIAEASLTIDGIFYVVDPGFAKVKIYNSKLGMDTLVVAPISQASAKQRAGRAGRTGPGKCYRLYTEQAYQVQMLPTSVPEIQRANLSNTVLQLKAMGINDLINFDFMDAPPIQTLIAALEQLYYLSALDDEGLLTKLGRKMAQFPLEPPLSKMLLTSIDFGCSEEIITIISMLSVQNIFYRPKQKETIADQKKTKFNHFEGDHLTFLSVYESWKNQGFSKSWCHENYIQYRSLKRAEDVKKQIIELLQRYKFKIRSCGGNSGLIRKTIVSGFFFHAAKKDPKGGYRTLVDDHQVYIHPSSSLFNKQPEWVVYHELIFTTKEYMRDVCSINPKWLIDVAPNFFKFTDEVGFVRKKRNEKLDPLNQKYGDPNAWRLSKRKG